ARKGFTLAEAERGSASNPDGGKDYKKGKEEFALKYEELQYAREVYATGLTLFTLVTGEKKLPTKVIVEQGEDGEDVEVRVLDIEKTAQKVKDVKEIDPILKEVILGMIDPDPEKRTTAKQALELLNRKATEAPKALKTSEAPDLLQA
nr:hypothetical protein [Parachlamydiaceae bacterium]